MSKLMANISVRKLDNQVYNQLRIRAAEHGVSMEEEARQIISKVVSIPERMSDVFRKHFGHAHGVDLDIANHQAAPHNPMDFNS
ncbi:MAG: hypothetical protein WCR08_03985 [Gammaproteobacteria bacterium]|nr:hypothetical protein [Legionellaceae bacterium]MBP9775382.1 hypothetical protein [Legionellaceae bacterium]